MPISKQMLNSLIKTTYQLTENEISLLLLIFDKKLNNPADIAVSITLQDLAKFEIGRFNLNSIIDNLMNMTLSLDINGKTAKVHWFYKAEVFNNIDDKNLAEIIIHPDVLAFWGEFVPLLNKAKIANIMGFKSYYSYGLFLFLLTENKGASMMLLEYLRDLLEVNNKYPIMRDLRKFVIELAISEINALTPYNVEYTLSNKDGKNGRRVKYTQINLIFSDKNNVPVTYNFNISKVANIDEVIAQHKQNIEKLIRDKYSQIMNDSNIE